MSELRKIPNVGKTTEKDLIAMGYTTIESLKGKTAEQLYEEECALRGELIDRCQLYLYRAVEYFVNTDKPDLSKCSWWYWKDEFVEPSPCGAVPEGRSRRCCGACRTGLCICIGRSGLLSGFLPFSGGGPCGLCVYCSCPCSFQGKRNAGVTYK